MSLLARDRFGQATLFARRVQAAQPDAAPPSRQPPERRSGNGGMQENRGPVSPPRDSQRNPEEKPN